MILAKTPAGLEALKDRHGSLSPRQRSAFILFDGKRTVAQVLAATSSMGITMDDVQAMLALGLLARPGQDAAPAAPPFPAAGAVPADDAGGTAAAAPHTSMALVERYQAAYLIATELTAGLGLRGLRLNLAVEAAASYEGLAALAPRIRDAVGEARYAPLQKALFG